MVPLSSEDERRYRVLGFWRRAAAGVIDVVVLVPIILLLALVTASVGGRPPRSLTELGPGYVLDLALDGGGVGLAVLVIAALVIYLYFFIFHALRGQTLGKRAMAAAVIDAYGEPPSIGRTMLRTAATFLSLAAFSVGWLWIGFDRERRALHDLLAGTYVIDLKYRRPAVLPEKGTG